MVLRLETDCKNNLDSNFLIKNLVKNQYFGPLPKRELSRLQMSLKGKALLKKPYLWSPPTSAPGILTFDQNF